MCISSISAIGHEGFEIRAILIELARLRGRHAAEGNITLTELRMEKIINYGCEVFGVQTFLFS